MSRRWVATTWSAWSAGSSTPAPVTTRWSRPLRPAPRRSPTCSGAPTPTSAGPGAATSSPTRSRRSTSPWAAAAEPWSCSRPRPRAAAQSTSVLAHGFLYAFGEEQSKVDLAAQTASVDGLLHVTTIGLHDATATGCKVRMKGDSENNVLTAYGHNIVSSGGGGRDKIGRIGNGFDLELPEVRAVQVGLPRPGRARPPVRQARRRRADRRDRPRRRQRRRRRRHLPHRGPQELRAVGLRRRGASRSAHRPGRPAARA